MKQAPCRETDAATATSELDWWQYQQFPAISTRYEFELSLAVLYAILGI